MSANPCSDVEAWHQLLSDSGLPALLLPVTAPACYQAQELQQHCVPLLSHVVRKAYDQQLHNVIAGSLSWLQRFQTRLRQKGSGTQHFGPITSSD